MSAVIVANGPLEWTPELARLALAGRPLVAADGGANALARIGLRPDLVIGDLDSMTNATRRWVGEQCILERPDQDRTDLEKALEHVETEVGATRVLVLGALGGRLDHALYNLALAARLARGERLILREADQLVLAHCGELEHQAIPGETWSFWSFDPKVLVTINGVRWPVQAVRLDPHARPSVSNCATDPVVRVLAENGPVVVMRHLRSRDQHRPTVG